MSTQTSTAENGTDTENQSIDHDRYVRACTEEMSITVIAPNMRTVEHNGREYFVDLVSGACDCPDQLYRHVNCEHLMKAALRAIYTEGVRTALVAHVASHAADHACPFGNHGVCSGPTGPAFPCPDCVEATTVDEWTIWQLTEQRTGVRR